MSGAAVEAIAEIISKRFGGVYTSKATLWDCAQAVLESPAITAHTEYAVKDYLHNAEVVINDLTARLASAQVSRDAMYEQLCQLRAAMNTGMNNSGLSATDAGNLLTKIQDLIAERDTLKAAVEHSWNEVSEKLHETAEYAKAAEQRGRAAEEKVRWMREALKGEVDAACDAILAYLSRNDT